MKILLLSHYYAPEFGAPQRRWGALIRGLIAAGHRVTVIAPPPHYPDGKVSRQHRHEHRPGRVERGDHGETIVRSRYLPHRGDIVTRSIDHAVAAADGTVRAALRFARRKHRPDVIVATAPAVESLVAGHVLSRVLGAPLIAEMRDAWPDLVTHMGDLSSGNGGRRAVRGVKGTVHRLLTHWQRTADAVVTTTEAFADVLRERGMPDVRVVRNGVDATSVVESGPHIARAEPELRCVYLGNVGRSQGLDVVVRAAAELKKRGVPVSVRIMGHGALVSELAQLAASLEAPVRVSTRIPRSLVVKEYAWADTVIVSLRDWEPLEWTIPSKLYEVLATGRHITGLLRGEAASLVEDTGAGDVVAPGSVEDLVALWEELAADPARTRGGTSRGREWVVENADDGVLVGKYLTLLHEVVDRGTKGSRCSVPTDTLFRAGVAADRR